MEDEVALSRYICILRCVIDGSEVFNLPLVLVIVDFKKAFYSISRSKKNAADPSLFWYPEKDSQNN